MTRSVDISLGYPENLREVLDPVLPLPRPKVLLGASHQSGGSSKGMFKN